MPRTKINRPKVNSKWVQRPRLISRLDEGLNRRVTLISAPPGYGKTTLVAQWLDHITQRSAWLSLDNTDSEPDLFLNLVIRAIETVVPGFGADAKPLLTSPTLPPPDYLADEMVSEFDELREPLVLVLDDYQTLFSETIQEMLVRMVERLPDYLHLLILTRTNPPWPLHLWRVREWLHELRMADLRFTTEEARSFFAQTAGVPIAVEIMDMLQKRTEGWAAGLQLVQVSLTDAENPEQFARSFSGSDRLVVDFLMEQVVSHQSEEIRDFLAVTALLGRFCAPLCDFLLSDHIPAVDARQVISRLERDNLFLVSLDSENLWYRYHHLFQDLLKQHLENHLPPERKNRLLQRAGEWFAREGAVELALQHFLAGNDVNSAALLIAKNLHAYIDKDRSSRFLNRLLVGFPESAADNSLALLVAHGYRKINCADLLGLRETLAKAEALLQDPNSCRPGENRKKLQTDIDTQWACYFFWQGNVETALMYAERALQGVPKEHSFAYGHATLYAGLSYAAYGQEDKGLDLLAKALSEEISVGGPNIGPILTGRAIIFYYAGDFDSVAQAAEQMIALGDVLPVPDYWLGCAHYFLGSVAYERNLLDTAAECFGRLEEMRYLVSTRVYHESLIGMAYVSLVRDDVDEAVKYATAARKFAVETNDSSSLQLSNSFETRFGTFPDGISAEPVAYSPSILMWLEIPQLTHADYLIRETTPGNCMVALEYIEDAIQQAERHHNIRQKLQFLAAKVLALDCAGKREDALEVLENTLRMAEPQNFVRTFVDRGPFMAELLNVLLKRRPRDPYLRRLLDAFEGTRSAHAGLVISPDEDSDSRSSQAAQNLLSSDLTRREFEVLTALAEHLTNKEIAERLFISPETVKTHVSNLFRKFDVSGRRQLLAAAKKAGVL